MEGFEHPCVNMYGAVCVCRVPRVCVRIGDVERLLDATVVAAPASSPDSCFVCVGMY